MCPDAETFQDCPGKNENQCSKTTGCEWCANNGECRAGCTCDDEGTTTTTSLFQACGYASGVATNAVAQWPLAVGGSSEYSEHSSMCQCEAASSTSASPTTASPSAPPSASI